MVFSSWRQYRGKRLTIFDFLVAINGCGISIPRKARELRLPRFLGASTSRSNQVRGSTPPSRNERPQPTITRSGMPLLF